MIKVTKSKIVIGVICVLFLTTLTPTANAGKPVQSVNAKLCKDWGGTWTPGQRPTCFVGSGAFLQNADALEIPSKTTLVLAGGPIYIYGPWTIFGTLVNSGALNNYSIIHNSGVINNSSTGFIANIGVIYNYNTIYNNSGGTIGNEGTIYNNYGGAFLGCAVNADVGTLIGVNACP